MSYYRVAIVAPMEYAEDNPTWRCLEDLRLAGHAAEVVDPRAFPGALDCEGRLDERALAPFLSRFRPHYVSLGGESARDIIERLENDPACNGFEMPASRFVVFGYVGPGNFGDELIFSLICREIDRRFPNSYVSLIGHDPVAPFWHHGVVTVLPTDKLGADVVLSGARCLIYMAGLMFDEAFETWGAGSIGLFLNPYSEIAGQAAFTLMAKTHDVPAVYLGIGAGPLANPDAQRLVRLEAAVGARYLPRDDETTRLLLNAGVPASQIEQKADLAFLLEPGELADQADERARQLGLRPGAYIAVSLREHASVPEDFARQVAGALDRVLEANDVDVLFVDLAPEDRGIHDQVIAAMRSTQRVVHAHPDNDEQSVVELLSSAACVLAMRLHCSIVANALGVPGVGLNYNEKVAAYYEVMGRSACLAPMGVDAGRLAAMVESALCEGRHAPGLEEHAAACRVRASEAFDVLGEILGQSAPPLERRMFYSRSVSVEELELREARQRIAQLEGQLQQESQHSVELQSSTTWKLGSAMTAVPRALKDALRAK